MKKGDLFSFNNGACHELLTFTSYDYKEAARFCDLANVLNMTKSSVSHQLATLRRSGIVKCRRSGKEVYYTLDDDHIVKLFEIGLEHINHKG